MKKILLSVSLVSAMAGFAQFQNRGCATPVPSEEWNTWFNKAVEDYKAAHPEMLNGKTASTSYTIAMIFHIVHGGQAVGTYPNIAAAQVQSQLSVLNADYNGTGYGVSTYNNLSLNGNGPFYDYAHYNNLPAPNNTTAGVVPGNLSVTFIPATYDPSGNPLAEPGIDRINYTTKGWTNPKSLNIGNFQSYMDGTIKPASIWDPKKYFNVWLTDEANSVGLLGYSTFPPGTTLSGMSGTGTSTTDGCWFWAKTCGSKTIYAAGTYLSGYDLGRTITHECGHYLGLRHTWGDGQCATDYCNDTPPEKTSTYYGTSTGNTSWVYPYTGDTCNGDRGDGIMYMNFMDYSDDAYMCLFTNDQVTRMNTAMTQSPNRQNLTSFAQQMGVHTFSSLAAHVGVYPNPSNGNVTFSFALPARADISVEIINMMGQTVASKTQGNVLNETLAIDLSSVAKGVYYATVSDGTNKAVKKIIIE